MHYKPEAGDRKIEGPSTADGMKKMELVNSLFGLGENVHPLVHGTGTVHGQTRHPPGLWPAKVVGVTTYTDHTSSGCSTDVCRIIIHCTAANITRQTKRTKGHKDLLLTEKWRMEYEGVHPRLRMIDPSTMRGTILVYEPKPRNPFFLLENERDEVHVHSVYPRDSVWPSQFLRS